MANPLTKLSSTSAQSAPDLLKALTIISTTAAKRAAVKRKELKTYWKTEKRPHFLR